MYTHNMCCACLTELRSALYRFVAGAPVCCHGGIAKRDPHRQTPSAACTIWSWTSWTISICSRARHAWSSGRRATRRCARCRPWTRLEPGHRVAVIPIDASRNARSRGLLLGVWVHFGAPPSIRRGIRRVCRHSRHHRHGHRHGARSRAVAWVYWAVAPISLASSVR